MSEDHPIFNSPIRIINDPPIRAWRRTLIGVGLSLLVHIFLLFIAIRHSTDNEDGSSKSVQGPIVVRLSQAAAPPTRAAPAPTPDSSPEPPIARRQRSAIALQKPILQSPPMTVEPPAPAPEPTVSPPMDMMAMIHVARERRAAANQAVGENADTQVNNSTPSANDIVMANINRSFQPQSSGRYGTNGVFQILHMGPRMAEFSFRGWTTDSRKNWRQFVEVDAGPQGDVELAVVRKMIELIRSHFDGDFNWESHRLGRIVVLSARRIDNAGLEDFLMREFFGVVG